MDERADTGREFRRAVLPVDHFVDLGGKSLSTVKLAIAVNRAVSLEDIAEHPILADMGELLHREHAPNC